MGDRTFVDLLRARLNDPVDVCRKLGLLDGARRAGRGLIVRCPVHEDRSPSCTVRLGPDGTIAVCCFGCNFKGDALHLVAAVERLDIVRDFPVVVAYAARLAGLDPDRAVDALPPPRRAAPPASPPPLRDERFSRFVSPYLRAGRLDRSWAAGDVTAYLDDRGVLELARLDGWAALPPPSSHRALIFMMTERDRYEAEERSAIRSADGLADDPDDAAIAEEELERSGMFAGHGFVHPLARLCIPWRRPDGLICNLQRRRLDDGEPRYVTPRGRPFVWPYGAEQLSRVPDAPVLVVEGGVDVLAARVLLAARREPAIVLGVPGVQGWRSSWAALARGRVALVGLDADDAGERAAPAMADDLDAAGARRIERWKPPHGAKDWAEALMIERGGA